MNEAVHHEPHDDHAPPAGDLGPKPVIAPNPPYDPGKFSTFFWLSFAFSVSGALLLIVLIGLPLLLVAAVFGAIFSFMSWKQIQDGHQRTTPGLAVGLMFIPLFNFYWMFVAFLGLAKDTNDYNVRWGINAPPVNEGFALTACILFACTFPAMFIPLVGLFVPVVSTVFTLIVMFQIKNAATVIAQARLEGLGHPVAAA